MFKNRKLKKKKPSSFFFGQRSLMSRLSVYHLIFDNMYPFTKLSVLIVSGGGRNQHTYANEVPALLHIDFCDQIKAGILYEKVCMVIIVNISAIHVFNNALDKPLDSTLTFSFHPHGWCIDDKGALFSF